MRASGTRRLGVIWILAVALLPGCALLPTRDSGSGEDGAPQVPQNSARRLTPLPADSARPDAPIDYDVLVGELAAQDGEFVQARDAYLRASHKDPDSAFLQRKLARLSLKLDDVDAAVIHAKRALDLEPEHAETRLFVARIHRIRLDLAGVELALLDPDGEPFSSTAVLLLYQVYLERGRLSDALRITQRLVDEEPELLDGHMALATVYEHLGKRESAVEVMRGALEHHPERPIVYSRLARMLRALKDYDAEITLYQEVLQERPTHFGTLVSLGEAQIAKNDLEGALDTYAKIVAAHPGDLQAIRRYASLEFAAGRYEQAAARLQAAFARNPEHFELAYSLGQVVRNMGDDARAIELFNRVPEYHPAYVEARLQLASIYEDREEYGPALEEVERLRVLRPSRALEFHTAELLTRTQRFDEALELLHAMRAETPEDDEVLYQLGVCYGTAKRVDEALEYMRLTLEKNPDNPHALNYIGYTWAERGENLDEAERMILRALDQRPNDGYITDSLAWVYYMRGLPLIGTPRATAGVTFLERARDQLFQAAEMTGGDPVISEHLGDVHVALDERQRALEFYQEAVRLEPRNEEQPDLIEKLEQLRQELSGQ